MRCLALTVAGSALAQDRPGLFDNMFGRNDQQRRAIAARRRTTRELSMRIERMESQMRQLTGTIEQLQYQNQLLQSRCAVAAAAALIAIAAGGRADRGCAGRGRAHRQPPAPPGAARDAFDPNANPNAPGAPRALGSDRAAS